MIKKIMILALVALAPVVFAQKQLDDCVKKFHSNWGAGCKGCDTKAEDAFEVTLQNVCAKKIDIVIAVQEANKHWMRFEKKGVESKDTMRSFVCQGTSKFQYWFKESGDVSLLPSYEEINAEYYKNNPNLRKKAKSATPPIEFLALKLLIGDAVKKPLINQTVYYRNSDGIKQKTITDVEGDFIMKQLSSEENLEIELEKNAELDKNDKVTLAKKNGQPIKEIAKDASGTFRFTFLPADLITLSTVDNAEVVEIKKKEATLDNLKDFASSNEKEIKVKRQVLFASGSPDLSAEAKTELDGIVKILTENPALHLEIIAHTDARGDDNTNLILSEKRAKNSVDYLISKGIKAERLKSKGLGETEILNQCKNNINCTETEHAVNRRTEFRFIKN